MEDVVALVHRTDPLAARAAARRALRWTDLRGATLLVHEVPDLEVSRLRRAVEGTWRAAAEPSLEVRRIPLTESIVELARARVGVGIVGRSSVPPYARGDDLVLLPNRAAGAADVLGRVAHREPAQAPPRRAGGARAGRDARPRDRVSAAAAEARYPFAASSAFTFSITANASAT